MRDACVALEHSQSAASAIHDTAAQHIYMQYMYNIRHKQTEHECACSNSRKRLHSAYTS